MPKSIKFFEINSYGQTKIKVDNNNREVEYTYWSVPTCVIRKFINSEKPPTIEDFEDWVQKERNKENKKSSKGNIAYNSCIASFWSKES